MDTSGFYKLDGIVLYAPNSVYSQFYTLFKDDYHIYEYPVDGWYWFDSKLDAYTFFNVALNDTEMIPDVFSNILPF